MIRALIVGGTSASQLYRLLGPANRTKSVGQMLSLLHLLGRSGTGSSTTRSSGYAGASARSLSAFAGDPKRVAQIVGAIAGGLGSKAMEGRVKAVNVAVVSLIEIAKGAGIHAAMSPDIEGEKRRIVTTLRTEGVHLTDREMEAIVPEVEANATVLQRELETVKREMRGLGI